MQTDVELRRVAEDLVAVRLVEGRRGQEVVLGIAHVAEIESGADDTDHAHRRGGPVDGDLVEAPR